MSGTAFKVLAHMTVVDVDGSHVGTVDCVEGDNIKLNAVVTDDTTPTVSEATSDGMAALPPPREPRYVPLGSVSSVEGDTVRLKGLTAMESRRSAEGATDRPSD